MKRRTIGPGRALAWGSLLLLTGAAFAQPKSIAPFGVVAVSYRDLDGDHDPFPDPGESGRVAVTIRNGRLALSSASLVLSSTDPDVACVPEWIVPLGSLSPGQTIEAGSLDPGFPGFTVKAAATVTSTSGADPARVDLCVRLRANELQGLSLPVCFSLPADLDPPAGPQTFIAGPDGLPGTSDDGTLLETFDTDRDGDGKFTVGDTFRRIDTGTGLVEHGGFMRAVEPPGDAAFSAVICGGYSYLDEQLCGLDPDHPMDWHLHCPPGTTSCPNLESGPCNDPLPGSACTYATPADGQKAASPPNSLHMGVHFAGRDSLRDTTRLRAVQAYRTGPINLTSLPRTGDLQLALLQIADLMDYVAPLMLHAPCLDCGDVQIQVDRAADPAVDDWGLWEKLAPYQNVYDHVPAAFSYYGDSYCLLTPTDAGTSPPAPYGYHETLCFGQGAWSTCGSVRGTSAADVGDCEGPGLPDPSGSGVWVQTRFDLSTFRGQRIRIRWVAESWDFDESTPHYAAAGAAWETSVEDDGWWLDDIQITGAIAAQQSPVPDTRPAVGGACPVVCTDLDGDGFGPAGSGPCPAGPTADCDDLHADVHPGAPEGCNDIDNDCDGALGPEEADFDLDRSKACEGDCDDHNYYIGPGKPEINDGLDNQCPGGSGYGLVDELKTVSFPNTTRLIWISQDLATAYQVVRSPRFDFSGSCTVFTVTLPFVDDLEIPPQGSAFFYLVRPSAPHVGDWWWNSAGTKRVLPCLP